MENLIEKNDVYNFIYLISVAYLKNKGSFLAEILEVTEGLHSITIEYYYSIQIWGIVIKRYTRNCIITNLLADDSL